VATAAQVSFCLCTSKRFGARVASDKIAGRYPTSMVLHQRTGQETCFPSKSDLSMSAAVSAKPEMKGLGGA